MSATLTHQGNFTQSQQNATYTATLTNTGGNFVSQNGNTFYAQVSEMLPAGLTLVSMTGTGWTCSANTCSTSTPIAAGATGPPITITVNVAANASSPQINQISCAGGSFPCQTVSDSTVILSANTGGGPAVVGSSAPYPVFAGDPPTSFPITVTNDAAGDVLTLTRMVDANTGLPCTDATCGTFGPITGASGSGTYSMSYTPPPAAGLTKQTVATFVVSSNLPGSLADTADFIEVDPPGILVDIGGAGIVAVGSAVRTYTSDVYNDLAGNPGVTFSVLTASGHACTNIGTNSCGMLGAPTKMTSGTTTTTTITYTPPPAGTAVPSAPYDRPLIVATSVADKTKFASHSLLITPTAPVNTGLRIPPGNKLNSALAGGAAIPVIANIANDMGNSRTVTWTLKDTNGVNCLPTTCGSLDTPVPTGNGTFVSSSVNYTPPASYPTIAADQTPTITAASADSATATDSFTFTIADEACSTVNNKNGELSGQYAFLLRGGGANAGYGALIGSFTADGAGHITGGLLDQNASGFGPFTGDTVQTSGSFYTVGSDNRVCLTLTDTSGGILNFRAAVGALVGSGATQVATQGRIILFNDNNGRKLRLSGVLMKQDTTSFNPSAFNGNYALGFEGVDGNGGRLAGAGVITTNGVSTISNLALDVDDAGGLGTNLTGGSGSYSIATNAPSGRGTLTTTINAPGPGGVPTPTTTNFVFYMVSSSEILDMSTDSLLAGKPIQSGEAKKQSGTFLPTALDGKDYVFYAAGIDPSNGGNDSVIGQATFAASGNATTTVDENDNGVPKAEKTAAELFTIGPNGRTTISGSGTGSQQPVLYLIDSTSAFIVGTDSSVAFGFVEQQTGGLSTASFSGPFFFGGDTPTTGSPYQSGTVSLDGAGNVNGNGDVSGPNGLKKDTISPSNGGTYSFSAVSTPQGRGTVGGPNSIAYAISGSKIVFMGGDPEPFVVQK